MPTTKQQVLQRSLDMARALRQAADRKIAGEVQRVQLEQIEQRRQLIADCEASGGHVFLPRYTRCMFCEADKNAGQQMVSRNLSRVA